MSNRLKEYRDNPTATPSVMKVWPLYGSGLENLGVEGRPVEWPVPQPGPDELLVRVDAAGLCFSDIKVLTQGDQHPRIFGRDLAREPVILGHECALTVVAVGANRQDRFKPGDRFIVQADIYYQGVNTAFGYTLPGALEQYTLIGKEILDGDEGCYLLPVQPTTGYAEAALSEPWACVVASYRATHRPTIKPDGTLWVVAGPGVGAADSLRISRGLDAEAHPRLVVLTGLPAGLADRLEAQAKAAGASVVRTEPLAALDLSAFAQVHTGGAGFDDVIVLGADAPLVEQVDPLVGRNGILCLVGAGQGDPTATMDVGRIHYDYTVHIGTLGDDAAEAYTRTRSSELTPGGRFWASGAGGPMGQMHVQRAAEKPDGPALIVATDVDAERLQVVLDRFGPLAEARGAKMVALNPKEMSPEEFDAALRKVTGGEGFTDIAVMVPVPAVISHCATHLGEKGLLNIFAGVPKGTMARIPILDAARKDVRFVGTSGSSIADLRSTLGATEEGTLSPNRSVAAIGSLDAAHDGLAAVKSQRFPGKVVLFPQITNLPLTPLSELKDVLPEVAAKLSPAGEWTREAEEALLAAKLGPAPVARGPKSRPFRRLEGQSALVTGGAQGLGEALASRLAAEGCHVAVADINEAKAEEVAARLHREYGVRTLAVRMDVTDDEQVGAAIDRVVATFGSLDVMVCNAGILIAGDAVEFRAADWRKVVDVNLVGYFITARHAARVMQRQGRGSIIQINSKSGKKGSFKNSAYAASKFGGIGLTQSLALEMAPYNVRVNSVCPGNLLDSPLWVDSLYAQYAKRWNLTIEEVRRKYEEQVPLGRGCAYDDVANLVVFLASDESSYMTGQAINVTGGQEMR
ncbi:MAG: sorbitol-6-phosphate dehydrogenase [Armatimonadetes bacterium]|nr:sorbitol-6-phosphate dehydrogenase [Armatimonadota bacterium]